MNIVNVPHPTRPGHFVDLVNPDDPENPMDGFEASFEYEDGYWVASNFWATLRMEFPAHMKQERMIEIFLSVHQLVRNDLR